MKSLLKFLTNVFLFDSIPINSSNSSRVESSMLWRVSNIPSVQSLFLFSNSICSVTDWSIFLFYHRLFFKILVLVLICFKDRKRFLLIFILGFTVQFFALFFLFLSREFISYLAWNIFLPILLADIFFFLFFSFNWLIFEASLIFL